MPVRTFSIKIKWSIPVNQVFTFYFACEISKFTKIELILTHDHQLTIFVNAVLDKEFHQTICSEAYFRVMRITLTMSTNWNKNHIENRW